MKLLENLTFLLVNLSLISCIVLGITTVRRSRKSQIRNVFFIIILIMFIWNLGTLLDIYWRDYYGVTNMYFIYMCYFGICFTPLAILLLSIVISDTHINLVPAHLLFLVVPVVTMIVIVTNDSHNLFFVNFSLYSTDAVYGAYYYFHTIYSYGIIMAAMVLLISTSVKQAGIFSRQSLLIIAGLVVPIVVNVLYSFGVAELSFSINASTFTFSTICFAIAFQKYEFLQVIPIALRHIVDLISDAYIVVDQQKIIVDYNHSFLSYVSPEDIVMHGQPLKNVLDKYCGERIYPIYNKVHERAMAKKGTVSTEYEYNRGESHTVFHVETTPIYQKGKHVGTVILLKDITQAKCDMKKIKDTQAIMIERERLASLGQMVGGIAHNLKTPILSISGGIVAVNDLVEEYRQSIGDEDVEVQDHHEIAGEMVTWLEKMKIHCAYISDMISTVKGQAVQFNSASGQSFEIDDFLKQVTLLMKYALKHNRCNLKMDVQADKHKKIAGDINSLVQIFDNLIINAIHAYEGRDGDILLSVTEENGQLVFKVTDYGKGIPFEIQPKLFREMVTTKGKDGTGLGLFMSYSSITGHFGGKLLMDSTPGSGTTFTITVPALPEESGKKIVPERYDYPVARVQQDVV